MSDSASGTPCVRSRHSYGWVWPGVPLLWHSGDWRGLAWAAGFALLINVQLLVTFVYTELLPAALGILGWIACGAAWLVGIAANRRWVRRRTRTGDALKTEESLYNDAFHDYLQRNWIAAETKCRELIRRRRLDVDARLLLATVLRHAGRLDEATTQLDALAKVEGSEKWALETALERRSLDEARRIANNSGNEADDGDGPATISLAGRPDSPAAQPGVDDTARPGRVIRNAA